MTTACDRALDLITPCLHIFVQISLLERVLTWSEVISRYPPSRLVRTSYYQYYLLSILGLNTLFGICSPLKQRQAVLGGSN